MPGFIRFAGNVIGHLTRTNRRVCIVSYHRVLKRADPLLDSDPDIATFRWHMELLAKDFNVLPLASAVAALRTGSLPPRAVCITFDDGYKSTFELAMPVLKELGLPATVFVTSGHLATGNMWNDRIIDAIRNFPESTIDLHDIDLGIQRLDTPAQRLVLVNKIISTSKYMSPTERESVVVRLEQLATADAGKSQNLMLTPEMITTLDSEGIEIGGHTISHPILMKISDELAWHEIKQNKEHLENIIGKPIRFFAYPNGKQGVDFDERHARMARDANFEAAFTTAAGAANTKSELFMIPRSRPWDKTPFMYSMRLLQWLSGL